ncbi:hypothetical protein E2320_007090, partial [Naja naja]
MQCSHYGWEGNILKYLESCKQLQGFLKRDKLSYFVLSLSYVSPEICTLPPKVGKCKAWFLRFYFNAATGNCEGFIYGGCEGNKNNFETLGQCRATCQRSVRGRKNSSFYIKAHFHTHPSLIFIFLNLPEAMLDMCNQPLDVGPCKENFTRFYYDRTTKICKPFKFGGCNGNRNNFLNREDCMQECKPILKYLEPCKQLQGFLKRDKLSYFVLSLSYVSPEICTLPPKVGKCKASFLRFYFNAATGNCEGFIYGGCGGNKNNFVTLGQCRATCQRS